MDLDPDSDSIDGCCGFAVENLIQYENFYFVIIGMTPLNE